MTKAKINKMIKVTHINYSNLYFILRVNGRRWHILWIVGDVEKGDTFPTQQVFIVRRLNWWILSIAYDE